MPYSEKNCIGVRGKEARMATAVPPPLPNFDKNGCFRAISTETFGQFVEQRDICVPHS